MFLGLLGLWFGVFAPFAIVNGALSLRRIRSSHGALAGAARAAAGLTAGIIGLAVAVLGVAYWILAR